VGLLQLVVLLELTAEPVQVDLRPHRGQVVTVDGAAEVPLLAVEHARGGISHREAHLVDEAAGILTMPAVGGPPRPIHVLLEQAHLDPTVLVLLRQLDVGGIVGVRGRTEVGSADVHEGHLSAVLALRVSHVLLGSSHVGGCQRDDRPQALQRRSWGKDRIFPCSADFTGHEP